MSANPSIEFFVVHVADGGLAVESLFLSLADDLAGYDDADFADALEIRVETTFVQLGGVGGSA